MNKKEIYIFTDGSSRGNPGPGGWGTVVVDGDNVIELGGYEKKTTNNRMEMEAAKNALEQTKKGSQIVLYTDSSYLINGITKWVKGWKRNDWKTKVKEDVLNKDLWMDLDLLSETRTIDWHYVGGHSGILGNERCDEIATAFADGETVKLFNGPLSQYNIPNILDIKTTDEKKIETKSRKKSIAYSYISSLNGVIETHRTWSECEGLVKGKKGARFKKSVDREDEEKIIREFEAL